MCCGKSRMQFRGAIPRVPSLGFVPSVAGAPAQFARFPRETFEYVGRTRLTVKGPVTGRPYHFDRPGHRLEVDTRDGASLTTIPMLRRLGAMPPEE